MWSRSAGAWTLDAKLRQPVPVAKDVFGWSVAIDGTTAVVGAPERSVTAGRQGASYVFVRGAGGWLQEAELVAADAYYGDHLGESVALRGDVAILGAPLFSDGAHWIGAAYAFARTDGAWTQRARLTASDAATSDRIGFRVAIGGTAVLVGGHLADRNGKDGSGTAYFFDFVP